MPPPGQKDAFAPRRPLRQRIIRALAVMGLVVIGLLVLGRLLPLPSTLMLARWATGAEVTRHWTPLERIAPALVRAVIASEDQKFCRHWGVDFAELRDVLMDPDGPWRGASTVTMQTVKNAYLWPGRSMIRKALEIPLALAVDGLWGKARVMEVYLNLAEWGEGLFGAEAAARHYFGKSAGALSPVEAARLVAALPNPFLRAAANPSAASRRVLARMETMGPYAACVTGETSP